MPRRTASRIQALRRGRDLIVLISSRLEYRASVSARQQVDAAQQAALRTRRVTGVTVHDVSRGFPSLSSADAYAPNPTRFGLLQNPERRDLPLRGSGFEAESGLAEEPGNEVGPVLDAPEPVRDSRGELADGAGGEVAQAVLPPGGDRILIAFGGPVRRDLPLNPIRCSRYDTPRNVQDTWNSRPISAAIRDSVHRWSSVQRYAAWPASSTARRRDSCRSSSLQAYPPWPLETSAASPPVRQARRHWYTDFVLTRSSFAIRTASMSCSNIDAACSRTFSRQARSSAVSPPPSACLITPA